MELWNLVVAAVSVVIAFVGISLTLYLRNRKGLSYEVVTNVPVIRVRRDARDDIEIRYKGTPVQDVQLVTIRIRNSGNTPIRPDEFFGSVTIRIRGQMLASDIIETIPSGLLINGGGGSSPNECHIQFEPLLLNPGDSITYKVLLTNYSGSDEDISVTGRIAGVKAIRPARKTYASQRLIVLTATTGLFLAVFAVALPTSGNGVFKLLQAASAAIGAILIATAWAFAAASSFRRLTRSGFAQWIAAPRRSALK